MKTQIFLLGLVTGVALVVTGCAAIGFNFSYYGLQAASYEGKLLAVDPSKDADLSKCMPDAANKGKCVVMFGDEFYAMKQDYINVQQELSDCQRGSVN